MHQIQSIIDRVRVALADDRIESTPEIQQLARDLHSVTRKLNERLRRCGEYLRQGLRAEAIQEAELEPRLLDAIGVIQSLSGDEVLAWIEMMQFLELQTPEPILESVAEMLDEAYGEHAPLERLLRLHRKLALQRAPLGQRLTLLRQIARDDPNSDFWPTDIKAYEEARLAQILQEARNVRKAPTVEGAQSLLGELLGATWSVPFPPRLVANLQSQLQEAVRTDARERLRGLAGELHAAFGAMDFERARPTHQEWKTVLPRAVLTPDDPLVLQTLPALSWCEQQLANEAAQAAWADHLHQVEMALNREPADETELRQLLDRTAMHRRPLPTSVKSRLTGRIASFENQRRRKRLVIVGGAVAATIAVVAAVVLVVTRVQDNALRRQVIARIQQHVDTGELKQAEEVREKYRPYWPENADWIAVAGKVDALAKTTADRTERVELLLERAATVPETDAEGFKRIIAEATAITEEAPALPDLRRTVEVRGQKIEITRAGRMKSREEDLTARLGAQGKQVEQLKSEFKDLAAADFDERRGRIRDGLSAIASELPGMAGRLADQHKFLLSEVDDLERQFTRNRRRGELLRDLKTRSRIRPAGNSQAEAKAYAELLSLFTTSIDDDPQSAGMKRAAAELSQWQSLFAVQAFPSDAAKLFPSSLELIGTRQNAIEKYLADYPQSPFRPALKRYSAVLGVLEKRYKPASGLLAQITADILESEHMRDLYILQVAPDQKNSWTYYVNFREPLREEPIIKFTRWSVMENPEEVKVLPKSLLSLKPAVAPQVALAQKIREHLKEMRAESWDATMSAVIQTVINENQVDPILRLQLLSTLCGLARSGSLGADQHPPFLAFEKEMTDAIERINLLTDWADPKSDDVKERRAKCLDYLRGIATLDFAKVWPSSKAALQQIETEFAAQYQAVGWMTYDDAGKPTLDVTLPAGAWTLVAVIPPAGGAEPGKEDGSGAEKEAARLEVLGRYERETLHLVPAATAAHFLPGRLVFARPLNSSSQVSSN
ncbi:hypothetical protein [Planctomyces sp. SH-PL14]|uniref:hypothetical protein n=1 Tax=Planctomyces sp. SH-PL14 TaxID=1632864 RepID=UPI00078E61EB|nr:hypothetical protein [Planctomyces sp. SH-PL14]AMV18225.1 hypothetical protein VT03_10075 [Planctomyces sp. SH-PL14]